MSSYFREAPVKAGMEPQLSLLALPSPSRQRAAEARPGGPGLSEVVNRREGDFLHGAIVVEQGGMLSN